MDFPKQVPRTFTLDNINAIGRRTMGCYGLFREGVWVYIGRGDIRERLLRHLAGDNACITRQQPTHYVDVVTDDHVEWEKQLILLHNPVCNKQIG